MFWSHLEIGLIVESNLGMKLIFWSHLWMKLLFEAFWPHSWCFEADAFICCCHSPRRNAMFLSMKWDTGILLGCSMNWLGSIMFAGFQHVAMLKPEYDVLKLIGICVWSWCMLMMVWNVFWLRFPVVINWCVQLLQMRQRGDLSSYGQSPLISSPTP